MKKYKIKLSAAALSAALCLSLLAGCSGDGNGGTAEVFTTAQTEKTESEVSESSSDAVYESAEEAAEAPAEALSLSYGEAQVYIDGDLPDGAGPVYTEDLYGHNFGFYVAEGNVVTMFFAVIPDEKCSEGASFTYDMLDGNTVLGMFVFDYTDAYAPQYAYYNSSENPEAITGGSIAINSFSSGVSAGFTMKMDYTVNGQAHTFEGTGCALYTDPESSGDTAEDDGTCVYCGGSGQCNVCHGLGYTSWGGTTIDCSACDGGVCYYCQGTGIQVYIVRGVPKN